MDYQHFKVPSSSTVPVFTVTVCCNMLSCFEILVHQLDSMKPKLHQNLLEGIFRSAARHLPTPTPGVVIRTRLRKAVDRTSFGSQPREQHSQVTKPHGRLVRSWAWSRIPRKRSPVAALKAEARSRADGNPKWDRRYTHDTG